MMPRRAMLPQGHVLPAEHRRLAEASGIEQRRAQPVGILGGGERAELGIGRTLQNVKLFPFLTIIDNVRGALHRLPWSGPLFLAAVLALGAMPPFGLFRSEFEIVQGQKGPQAAEVTKP